MIAKIKKVMTGAVLMLLFLSPIFAYSAATPETTAGLTGITYECVNGNCDFNDLVRATNKVVDFGRNFALMFSVVVIAIAGFKLMISGDMPKKREEAKAMFWSVGKGIV